MDLIDKINLLTHWQKRHIENIIGYLNKGYISRTFDAIDFFQNEQVFYDLGDFIRLHHYYSSEPFTKDKFEYALLKAFSDNNFSVTKAPRGNPGYDISIMGEKYSVKTQADASIKAASIHISKFMELGKGDWTDKLTDLYALRDQFLAHLSAYNRIITLRCIQTTPFWHYELVEIPKKLLLLAIEGEFEMRFESKQLIKPGYCNVFDSERNLMFALYFDGGGERKLQIKHISKRYCTILGSWAFEI